MAVTSVWAVSSRVEKALDYIMNPEKTVEKPEFSPDAIAARKAVGDVIDYASNGDKTEQMMYVTGINCTPDSAIEEFMNTKRYWGKTGGRLAYHGYQAFLEGDGEMTPELAHYGAHDLGIGASQLQAVRSFTRADGRACRDNDDVCIFAVFVVTEVELDVRAVDATRCMAGVLSFAPSLVFVEVDEDYFRSQLEISNLVCNCRTNVAGADNDDFSSVVHLLLPPD